MEEVKDEAVVIRPRDLYPPEEFGSIQRATGGLAYGGETTPGPFSESMQSGLEEEIDVQDIIKEPGAVLGLVTSPIS